MDTEDRVLAALAREQLRTGATTLALVDLASRETNDPFAAREALQRLLWRGLIQLDQAAASREGAGHVTANGLQMASQLPIVATDQ
jgi:hypothetical protein